MFLGFDLLSVLVHLHLFFQSGMVSQRFVLHNMEQQELDHTQGTRSRSRFGQ